MSSPSIASLYMPAPVSHLLVITIIMISHVNIVVLVLRQLAFFFHLVNISKYRNTESIHSDKLKKSYRISLNEKYKSTIFYTIVYVSRIILFIITYSLLLTMHNFKVSTIIGMYI